MNNMEKEILYIDMDGVLVDFAGAIEQLPENIKEKYEGRYDEIPGFYNQMLPMNHALRSYKLLKEHFEIYILSTPPWDNPSAWSGKIQWVKLWMDELAFKNLILTHRKDLNKGAYLIDDRTKNGAAEFDGELILFGSDEFPDWESITDYLIDDGEPKPKVQQIKY